MPAEEQPFNNFQGVNSREDQEHTPLCWHLLDSKTYQSNMCKDVSVDLFMFFFFQSLKP